MRAKLLSTPLGFAVASFILFHAVYKQTALAADLVPSADTVRALSQPNLIPINSRVSELENLVVKDREASTTPTHAKGEKNGRVARKSARASNTQRLKEYESDPDSIESSQAVEQSTRPIEDATEPVKGKTMRLKEYESDPDSIESPVSGHIDDSLLLYANDGTAKGVSSGIESSKSGLATEEVFSEYDVDQIGYDLNGDGDVLLRRSLRTNGAARNKKADTKFNIDFGFVGKITAKQKEGFLAARRKWQSIIVRDSSARVCINAGQALCGLRFTRRTCIDDLFIGVRIRKMDGIGRMYDKNWNHCLNNVIRY